jgi:AmmeMemoRadiSam system protein B
MEGDMQTIRRPAVAGVFYPGIRQVLADDIEALLDAAALDLGQDIGQVAPKAIVVPHAGYIYSGQTAAMAYAWLAAGRKTIKRVVLLGPVHRVPVRGLALPGVDAFATPLGEIEIDMAAIASLAGMTQVVVSPAAHAQEHSLEVQLPFLQSVLEDFKLVPLAVGDATPGEMAQVLDALWGGPETVIVVSSDLSHFLPYALAQAVDQQSVQNILGMKGSLTHQQACGGTPVNGLVFAARKYRLRPRLLDVCNSGDTAGDKNRVVGYASFIFTEETSHVRDA